METISTQCPYCGEDVAAEFDPGVSGIQRFIVDCDVCCHPITFTVRVDHEGGYEFEAKRDSDV